MPYIATTERANTLISTAERLTNERDVDGILDVFHPEATWKCVIDGVILMARGHNEILQNWRLLCEFLSERDITVRKRVLLAHGESIVSTWDGTGPRGARPGGIECWTVNPEGAVIDQTLMGFLDPLPAHQLRARARFLRSQPGAALAMARLTARYGFAS